MRREAHVSDGEKEELRRLARAHHVHFDVGPEVVFRGTERINVGYVVRLWAVHEKGARAMPGCSLCRDLVKNLHRIAEAVLPARDRPTATALDPYRPALYESGVVPGADEVSLEIRLHHRDDYALPIDACEERCLREIRAALRALGVPER